jgi:uncharacterized Zn finger protein
MTALSFDLERVRERLGEKRFKRAQGYAERGWVRIVSVESGRVSAFVTGERGDIYGVEVDQSGDGVCSCPDYQETQACKHLGALALAADGLQVTEARLVSGRFARLKEALAFEDASALAGMILRLARSVPGVLEALEDQEPLGTPE